MKDKKTFIFAALGTCGGLLTMTGDYLLEYLGGLPSNTLGVTGAVESAWLEMAAWRFPASIVLGVIGSVLFAFGYTAVHSQLKKSAPIGSEVVRFAGLLGGTVGGTLIHVMLCLMPVVFQTVARGAGLTLAAEAVDNAFLSMYGVFWGFYLCLLIPFFVWTFLVLRGKTSYARWTALLVIPVCLASIAVGTLAPGMEWLKVGAMSRVYVFMFCISAVYAMKEKGSSIHLKSGETCATE